MEKEKTNISIIFNWLFGILLLVMFLLSGYSFYQLKHQSVPDVIYLHDTVTIKKDSIITKTKWRTCFDTIKEIHYKDTILYDTIQVPIEHKVSEFELKKDSFELKQKIHHSGWHTNIDSVECSYSFNYEITKLKPKKIGLVWNIGLYAGYGINFNNGQYYFSPEVGVGASIGLGGFIK